ncbi:MAG: smalltalk protein [Prevotellaceae bacterium]|nr:smalltalk protein [Candidatus Minthosoma caballi]
METNKKDWRLWLQIVLTVITAIASALGVTSCAMKGW